MLRKLHPDSSFGLVDGGASHPLRKAKANEWSEGSPISVKLAVGQSPSHLRMLASGTLVTQEDVQPIVPLGQLVRILRCKVTWNTESCIIMHQTRGLLPVVLNNDCPELPLSLTLELIAELEQAHGKQQQWQSAVRKLCKAPAVQKSQAFEVMKTSIQAGQLAKGVAEWAKSMFPEMPTEILEGLIPLESWNPWHLPFNRRRRRSLWKSKDVLVHLFSGEQRWQATGNSMFLEVDINKGWDLLDPHLYGFLAGLGAHGAIGAVIGGPPCRTTSKLRTDDGGPPVLRERFGPERYGKTGLSPADETKVINDNLLWFRMLVLYAVAEAGKQIQAEPCLRSQGSGANVSSISVPPASPKVQVPMCLLSVCHLQAPGRKVQVPMCLLSVCHLQAPGRKVQVPMCLFAVCHLQAPGRKVQVPTCLCAVCRLQAPGRKVQVPTCLRAVCCRQAPGRKVQVPTCLSAVCRRQASGH